MINLERNAASQTGTIGSHQKKVKMPANIVFVARKQNPFAGVVRNECLNFRERPRGALAGFSSRGRPCAQPLLQFFERGAHRFHRSPARHAFSANGGVECHRRKIVSVECGGMFPQNFER